MKKLYQIGYFVKSGMPFYKRLFAYFIDWYIISVLTILPINLIYGMTFQQKTFESTLSKLPFMPPTYHFSLDLFFFS